MNYKTYDQFVDTLKNRYEIEIKDHFKLYKYSIYNKKICKNNEYEVNELVYKYENDMIIYHEKLYFNESNKLEVEYKLITCINLNLFNILGGIRKWTKKTYKAT